MVLLYYAFLTFRIFMNIVPLSPMPPHQQYYYCILLLLLLLILLLHIIAIHASQISVVSSGSRCISPKEYTMGMSYGRLGGRSSSVLRCEHAIILLRLSMLCSSINHNSTSNIRRRCISLWRRRCIFRNLEVRRSAA